MAENVLYNFYLKRFSIKWTVEAPKNKNHFPMLISYVLLDTWYIVTPVLVVPVHTQ